jgi:small subunit ribosomal protein S8
MVNDPIADLLTRIRNAQAVRHRTVTIPASKLVERVLAVLKSEGFIESYQRTVAEGKFFEDIEVTLKYYPDGAPMIGSCRRVSKCGRRIYSRAEKLPRVECGLGIAIVSTSQGVMSDREARKRKIGGEVLAAIS